MKPTLHRTITKILVRTILVIFSLLLGLTLLVWLFLSSGLLYNNEAYEEIYSPDNQYKVAIGTSHGAAMIDDSSFVSILTASDKISNIHGTRFDPSCIMGLDEGPGFNELRAKWTGDRSIKIYYAYEKKCLFHKKHHTVPVSNIHHRV